jgi:hypothetical protein
VDRSIGTTSPGAATRLNRSPASGLAVDCRDWPVAYPQTAMSALFLLQQRNWRSNLNASVSRPRGRPRSGLSHLTKS